MERVANDTFILKAEANEEEEASCPPRQDKSAVVAAVRVVLTRSFLELA